MKPAPLKYFHALLILGWLMIAAIALGSLMPMPASPIDVPQGDKAQHLLGYGILMFWFCQLYPERQDRLKWLLYLFLFGLSMEIAQGTLTIYRSADSQDVIANSLGLLAGWLLSQIWQPLRRWHRVRG